jgi:hypothetical protein
MLIYIRFVYVLAKQFTPHLLHYTNVKYVPPSTSPITLFKLITDLFSKPAQHYMFGPL